MHDYGEVYRRLTNELAAIIFMKRDGTLRVMLGTRSLDIAALEHSEMGRALGGIDNRCNIRNGNIGVIDMVLGDTRSFSIERLVAIEYYERIDTKEKYEEAYIKYKAFKKSYEDSQEQEMGDLMAIFD